MSSSDGWHVVRATEVLVVVDDGTRPPVVVVVVVRGANVVDATDLAGECVQPPRVTASATRPKPPRPWRELIGMG
jgi:hypothetical protein